VSVQGSLFYRIDFHHVSYRICVPTFALANFIKNYVGLPYCVSDADLDTQLKFFSEKSVMLQNTEQFFNLRKRIRIMRRNLLLPSKRREFLRVHTKSQSRNRYSSSS
jgi:hypothetical protein